MHSYVVNKKVRQTNVKYATYTPYSTPGETMRKNTTKREHKFCQIHGELTGIHKGIYQWLLVFINRKYTGETNPQKTCHASKWNWNKATDIQTTVRISSNTDNDVYWNIGS